MSVKSELPSRPVVSLATPSGHPAAAIAGSPRATRIRLLIADDHEVVREGLASMISRQPDMQVVAQASDGRGAVDLWKEHRPDVTLLDLRMPELDGLGAVAEIRAQDASARLIILTAFETDEDVYQGIQAGAQGFLLKDGSRADLLRCIREVHAGEIAIPPTIAVKLAKRVGGEELTSRETEVLRLLARGGSNKAISQTLCISETTVKSHVKGIFAKLTVLSRTEAVAAASRRGLVRL